MQPWIDQIKNTIYSIICYIKAHNKHSAIRIGFLSYRDFKDAKRFQVLRFTEKLEVAYCFIARLRADGVRDIPEDVSGGLTEGL
jgi:hypothetical protein